MESQKKCILEHFLAIAENQVGQPLNHQVAEKVFYDKKACQLINICHQIGSSCQKNFFFCVWHEEKYTALKGIQKKCILEHFWAIAENPVGHPLHQQVAEKVFYDKNIY